MFKDGRDIKISLIKRGHSQVWLLEQLAAHGITTEKTELSSVLSGARIGPKAEKIIQTAKEILKDGTH